VHCGQSRDEVEFRLLGPVEVVFSMERISIGAARQEIVLTMLLLETDRIVGMDLLIDAIWGDSPPSTAKSQVQICVSQLRKVLARSDAISLQTRRAGYVLEVPDGSLDLQRFRSLTARAADMAERDATEAVNLYRAGLGVWRGDACAGVESRIVGHAATRLNESRRTALGDCIDLELRSGGHNRVIGELSELVAQQPLWERPRQQLMLALYRSGRAGEALKVYQTARMTMREDLGLEPSKETQALQQSILVGDGALDSSGWQNSTDGDPAWVDETAIQQEAVPQLLPSTIADFVGRSEDLARISAVLTRPQRTDVSQPSGIHVPIVVLTGRGGVGKTNLALRAAHLLSESFPDGQLYAKLRDGIEPVVSTSRVLDRFLRAFRGPSALPDTLEERAEMYRNLLAGKKVLIMLDDAASVSQVEPLLPGHPGCAVIITCRTRAACPSGATCLEVGALDGPDGTELLAQVIGTDRINAEPEAATAMVELCEGLPLALRIAAAKLASRPHWRIERLTARLANERRRLDELSLEKTSIRAMLDLTYQNLTAQQQRLLRRLSVLGGSDFPCWLGAPLLETDVMEAEELLEELVVNGLIEAWNTQSGETRYHLHDLVRLYAAEATAVADPAGERQALITRFVGCLLSLTSEAHQRYYGGAFYIPTGDGFRYPLSAETVNGLLTDPIAWLRTERALIVGAAVLAARAGLDEMCWELLVTTVTLFEAEPYPEDWREAHLTAIAVTRDAGNKRGTAALLFSLGTLTTTRKLDEAADLLQQSCLMWEELGDAHGLALALHGLAGVERLRGEYGNATARYQRVLSLFEQIGDYAGQAAALRCLGQIAMDRQDPAAAEVLFGRAVSTAERARSWRDMAQARFYLGELWLQRGNLKTAEKLFQTVCSETRVGTDAVGQGYAFLGLGSTYIRGGNMALAADNLHKALALAEQTNDMLLRGRVLLAGAELCVAEGRYEPALSQVEDALDTFTDYGSSHAWHMRALEFANHLRLHLGHADGDQGPSLDGGSLGTVFNVSPDPEN
jgi:DNA-binding SARP family transcriptional activator/tetratricopeptide (TPR) repeat protein